MIAITGAIDIVTDGERSFHIRDVRSEMSALCTPAKLDVGTATLLSASGACLARTGTECRTPFCRRTDDENIKHCIHHYFRNAVLDDREFQAVTWGHHLLPLYKNNAKETQL